MKVSIHTVTFEGHFKYLTMALRSVVRFARGFDEHIIHCPARDQKALERVFYEVDQWTRDTGQSLPFPRGARFFDEWEGKGMLHHMLCIMFADHSCAGDFILHMDSDHTFTSPVSPADYIRDGRADLVCAAFDWLVGKERDGGRRVELGILNWQNANLRALGVMDDLEFMRRAPQVHARQVYERAREDLKAHTGHDPAVFIRDQRNAYPQTFAEFQCLGSVAYRKFNGLYNWHRQEQGQFPPGHVRQAWSHRNPTDEDVLAWKQMGIL